MQDNETVITISTDDEEWYGEEYTCNQCGGMFMAGSGDFEDEDNTCTVKFCPYCGRQIIGWRKGKHTQFTFKENENANR